MREKLQKFMYGRNGTDKLSRFTGIMAVVFLILSMLIRGLRDVFYVLALAALIYTYYRTFSKNLAARRKENNDFINFGFRIKEKLRLRRDMWSQRKEYRFFKCPSCGAMLRVPKGKGWFVIV